MKIIKVKITTTTETLGTNPADKDIFKECTGIDVDKKKK
jgi:hypothetical protein